MAPERSARVREARGATVKTITLPADHVEFSEVAHLIASALYPLCEDSTDGEMFTHGCARINLEAELIKAVKAGTLPVKDPLTFGPHTFPMGHALQTSLVAANDLRDFLAGRGLVVEVAESQPAPVAVGALDDEAWKTKAREHAAEIIKRQREGGYYPSQVNLGDEIARRFRADGIVGADGKPLSGATIKRHALKGVSSAQGKQLSIQTGRGKWGK